MKRYSAALGLFAGFALFASHAPAQSSSRLELTSPGETIVLEPYAPNILRVTISKDATAANAGPGYGFVAKPDAAGWSANQTDSEDVYKSDRMVVTVHRPHPNPGGHRGNLPKTAKYFSGSAPWASVIVKTPDGKQLLEMRGWDQAEYNHKDGTATLATEFQKSDPPSYIVGASFTSPDDEHYYGLGQNHEGYLDHRGHTVDCWHNYTATAAPSVCVPFVVTNYGYGMIWDNPSKTTIEPGFNERTKWTSEVGNRVSFFVIAGSNTDEIYSGYRLLTGATPLMPKAAYGFVQCKQRYITQDEMLAVAKGYRDRHLPADVLVLDWFYYTKMGEMDFSPEHFPDPAAMNKQLHDMGFQTMISVWPRFTKGSRFYDFLLQKGWFEHLADGTPTDGLPYDRAGSDIDTTNPEAAHWYWET